MIKIFRRTLNNLKLKKSNVFLKKHFNISSTVILLVNDSFLPLNKLHSEILIHLGLFSKKGISLVNCAAVVITYFSVIVVHQWHLLILFKRNFVLNFLGENCSALLV